MKRLVIYYSKTGNTKKVAEEIIKKTGCDYDELQYDEKSKSISYRLNPSEYEQILLLSPIWAFSLSEPMKLYINEQKEAIKNYSLVVTYGLGGLKGCVNNCKTVIGNKPVKAIKIKGRSVSNGTFDISSIL